MLNERKIEETNGLQDIIFPKIICINAFDLKPGNNCMSKQSMGNVFQYFLYGLNMLHCPSLTIVLFRSKIFYKSEPRVLLNSANFLPQNTKIFRIKSTNLVKMDKMITRHYLR